MARHRRRSCGSRRRLILSLDRSPIARRLSVRAPPGERGAGEPRFPTTPGPHSLLLFENARARRLRSVRAYRAAGNFGGTSKAEMVARSLWRAWNIRVFTVLTGHSAIAAISSHE